MDIVTSPLEILISLRLQKRLHVRRCKMRVHRSLVRVARQQISRVSSTFMIGLRYLCTQRSRTFPT